MWDTMLINSRGRFDCTVAEDQNKTCTTNQPLTHIEFHEGKTYLLRLINMGADAPVVFSIDGHEFSVIAADAEPVELTQPINALVINVGQRYDIVVKAKKGVTASPPACLCPTDSISLEHAILDYCNGAGKATSGAEPTSTAWTDITTVDEIEFLPADVVELPETPDKRVIIEFNLVVSATTGPLGYIAINGGNYSSFKLPDEPPLFSIANGMKASDLPTSANIVSIEMGQHIEVVLANVQTDQHPFHMHTHTPWVVASGQASREAIFNGDITSLYRLDGPVKRDTYTVPPCNTNEAGECVDVGYTVLRFDTDNPGAWLMHCHVEWHKDIGMTMLFIEGEEEIRSRGVEAFSTSMRSTCNGKYAV